jgi:hypothetical protein
MLNGAAPFRVIRMENATPPQDRNDDDDLDRAELPGPYSAPAWLLGSAGLCDPATI